MGLEHIRFPNKKTMLIGAVIAAVIFVVLASVDISVPPYSPSTSARARLTAEMRVGLAAEAWLTYYKKNHKLPLNKGELWNAILEMHPPKEESSKWFDPNLQEVVDPWGTPLSIQESSQNIIVTSAGPDKRFGTDDDILETRSLPQ